MNLQEFNEQVVKVTIKDLGNPILNKVHMVTGFTSEILDELTLAISIEDETNTYEELGDTMWFALGAMNVYGLKISEQPVDCSKEILEDMLRRKYEDFSGHKLSTEDYYIYLITLIGVINSFLKKEVVSGVIKYEGKELSTKDLQLMFDMLVWCVYQLIIGLPSISSFEIKKELSLSDVLEMIKNKLLFRHKGIAMTTESDLNRDLSSERKILES